MATPILESIRQSLVTALQGVTIANGYDVTLAVEPVGREPSPLADAEVHVALAECTRAGDEPHQHVRWDQRFVVAAYVLRNEGEVETIQSRLITLRSAVEKAVMVDPQRGNYADDTIPDGASPIDGPDDQNLGIAVSLTVRYTTLLTDPYSL